jgi:hypothetical protein
VSNFSATSLSRELKVEAHRLAAWRDDFLAAGRQGLKGHRPDRGGMDQMTWELSNHPGAVQLNQDTSSSESRHDGEVGRWFPVL